MELSQKYLADTFGEDWQDEYNVWDCAAGTGNLLAGLTNKYNIWASTLDKADVDVMKDRIENGANLLESHVFQFDFLNDDFSKLPKCLQEIINDPKRRKKLIIYINPPYAEAASTTTRTGTGQNKQNVAKTHKTSEQYKSILGRGINELFVNFFIRVYKQLPDVMLASFSTLKYVTSSNFVNFRNHFKAKNLKGFICPANTFDNVNGEFPIGFLIWDLSNKEDIKQIKIDVFDKGGIFLKKKFFYSFEKGSFFSNWLSEQYDNIGKPVGYLKLLGTDIQNNEGICVYSSPSKNDIKKHMVANITINNLIQMSIYLAVRKCIEPTWINNGDQFLYPNKKWEKDIEFQNDCLAYTLFRNYIQSKHGVNHWIPFSEHEINARDKFDSHFMKGFINGKIIPNGYSDLFEQEEDKFCIKREFSQTAQNVFNAGRELWRYYHAQPFPSFSPPIPLLWRGRGGQGAGEVKWQGVYNVNASLYDIREYFQGRNEKGKMNNKSDDETYNELIGNLRSTLKNLAEKIEPKVYEYGFLKN